MTNARENSRGVISLVRKSTLEVLRTVSMGCSMPLVERVQLRRCDLFRYHITPNLSNRLPNLRVLDVSQNPQLAANTDSPFPSLPHLEALRARGCGLTPQHFSTLGDAFPRLVSLDLAGNGKLG